MSQLGFTADPSLFVCPALQVFNHLHFPGQKFRIWAEYIPQICFLVGIFGYMDIMILMKYVLPRIVFQYVITISLLRTLHTRMLFYTFCCPSAQVVHDFSPCRSAAA